MDQIAVYKFNLRLFHIINNTTNKVTNNLNYEVIFENLIFYKI